MNTSAIIMMIISMLFLWGGLVLSILHLMKHPEELDEVLEAMAAQDAPAIADEVGDLLFAVVNLARHLKLDAEATLRQASSKFERRFRMIEQLLRERGQPIENCTLEQLDALWAEVKQQEKSALGC